MNNKFEVTMMCGACKEKITNELKKNGYSDFEIDLTKGLLTFKDNVNPFTIIRIISKIGYNIKRIDEFN